MTDSYFSEVIDRRFSPTPTETEEEPILVYLPQLSPDMSFCTNALDIPSDDITFQKRPCIKKQVSFSEQLSTVIDDLDDDDDEEEEGEEAATSPISSFVRTLSNELSNHSAALPIASNREKFIPVLIKNEKKKEGVVVPQKLSNKLLDIFQKKPIATTSTPAAMTAAAATATAKTSTIATSVDQPARKELVHLTKSRPRKPASLKKPTNLAYPAAIAQPDWRTRVITTKKSPVFI
ncbi:hypothetical protein BD770DRAFT_6871 [Pilaira anomala]|nr:hypothetical protein BD770DRAFT_6871 [Pilaira anomala]